MEVKEILKINFVVNLKPVIFRAQIKFRFFNCNCRGKAHNCNLQLYQ